MPPSDHPTGQPLKAEQTFFADPAADRLMAMLMTVAAELHVSRDRLAALEMLLEDGKPVTRQALDGFEPSPAQRARLDAARRSFADALMACAMGIEASLGAPEEGVEKFDRS